MSFLGGRRTPVAGSYIDGALRGIIALVAERLMDGYRRLGRLDQGIQLLRSYLDIQALRFGTRLSYQIELPPELAERLMRPASQQRR